jgi:two-component sensor histidine kinase
MWGEGDQLLESTAEVHGMERLVRDFDWASTPLGPVGGWPRELKTVVRQILQSGFPAAVVWGPEHTTIYNDAFRPILGDKPEALGRSFDDIWSEAWADIGPIADRAYKGEATFVEDFPLVIDRFGKPEQAWFTFCYSPLRLSDGTVAGMIDTVVETTKTVRARADLDVLNKELAHRLKNTLTLVQAIAEQTLAGVSERQAVDSFKDRLRALGHAHDVLLRHSWAAASLDGVVRETLAPLDGLEQITIEGPDIAIASRAALSLSLILHELATNAAKYGALSVPDGRVALSWTAQDGIFRMHWREFGGPEVQPPTRSGFGSRLIRRGLASVGNVDCRYNPGGFEMDLGAPLAELVNS